MKFKIGDIVADKDMKGPNGEWPCFMGQIIKIGEVKFGRKWIPSLVVKTLAGKEEIGFQEYMVNISEKNKERNLWTTKKTLCTQYPAWLAMSSMKRYACWHLKAENQ